MKFNNNYILIICIYYNINTFISVFVSKSIDKFFVSCYTILAEVRIVVNITSAIRDTISISLFNRGLAGKIFEDVKQTGAKVVMKNNTAECVLLSPQEYVSLMDEVNDARLLSIANERMQSFNPDKLISSEDLYKELGITKEALEAVGEVEFE